MAVADELTSQIAPLIEELGYECVGVEYVSNPKNRLVRIYIDQPVGVEGGIEVEDCASVSREVSAWLDVEDPISGEYSLEVSSPGVERPLFSKAHYERFVGERAQIQLVGPMVDEATGQRQRVFKGTIQAVVEGDLGPSVVVLTEQGERTLPLSQVAKARLQPDMDQLFAEAKAQRN